MKGFARISHAVRTGRRFNELVAAHHATRTDAWAVWTFAILISSEGLTDGHVYKHAIATIIDPPRMEAAIDALCAVGLFARTDDHSIQIVDYHEHNNTKAAVEALVERRRIAGSQKSKLAKSQARKQTPSKRLANAEQVLSITSVNVKASGEHPYSDSSSVSVSEIPDPEPPPEAPSAYVARVGSPTGPFAFDEPTVVVPEHHRKLVMPIVRACKQTYADEFSKRTALLWPGHGSQTPFEKLAAWALLQAEMSNADPFALAQAAIRGMFETRERRHWSLDYLIEKPADYAEDWVAIERERKAAQA